MTSQRFFKYQKLYWTDELFLTNDTQKEDSKPRWNIYLHYEYILHLLISKKEHTAQFEPQMEEAIVNNAPFGRGVGFDWVTEVTFVALYGISGIHGSRYNPPRLSLPDVGVAGTLYHHPSHAA